MSLGEIRPIGAEHLEAILDIARGSFPVVWAPKEFTYFLSRPYGVCLGLFVADGNGAPLRLASYFLGLLVQGELDIVSIATHPSMRGKGHAYRLLTHVRALPGVERAFLEVSVENAAAIALYRKLGFEPQGIRKKYYQQKVDACLMRWVKDS